MTVSVTQQAVRRVVAVSARRLSPAGFRRSGIHLVRQAETLFHAFNFQASRWGSSDAGSFTVNVTVTSDFLHRAWTGQPMPKNPASAVSLISERIGHLRPNRLDHWWEVDTGTDLDALATDVVDALVEFGLPFFEPYSSATSLLECLRSHSVPGLTTAQAPLVHAIVAAEFGLREEAYALLDSSLVNAAGHPFAETVQLMLVRLGLAQTSR